MLEPPFLLIASPELGDPNFRQAVVLLVEYNAHGAIGFVVNRPSPYSLDEVVANDLGEVPAGIPVWAAGPVETDAGFVLFPKQHSVADTRITDGVWLGASQPAVETLIRHFQADTKTDELYPYRLLIGYAGWGPNQLDDEVKRGSWLTTGIDEKILFSTPHKKMWEKSLAKMGVHCIGGLREPGPSRWLN